MRILFKQIIENTPCFIRLIEAFANLSLRFAPGRNCDKRENGQFGKNGVNLIHRRRGYEHE
jgi:hypothetical protein